MTHETFAEKLLDLAYGELPPREARKVEAHAASCETCREELARIRDTRRLMSALPAEPAPEQGERILLAAAREEAARRAPRRRLPPWVWGASLAAASLVAVAAVSYRIMALRPGPLQREDREALLGPSPYAARSPEVRAEPLEARKDEVHPPAEAPPAPQERRKEAPARAERPARRYATPPEARDAAQAPSQAPAPAADVEAKAEAKAGAMAAAPPPAAPGPAPERPRAARAEEAERDRALAEAPAVAGAAPAPMAEAAAPTVSRAPAAASAPPARGAAKSARAPERPEGLAFVGPPRVEVRTFRGCVGESSRRVERDEAGRVVTYVREGRIDGRRVRVVHAFGPDGALTSATVHDLDAGGPPRDARALGLALPARAEDALIDAPPRCGR
jgi:hypothetical protein